LARIYLISLLKGSRNSKNKSILVIKISNLLIFWLLSSSRLSSCPNRSVLWANLNFNSYLSRFFLSSKILFETKEFDFLPSFFFVSLPVIWSIVSWISSISAWVWSTWRYLFKIFRRVSVISFLYWSQRSSIFFWRPKSASSTIFSSAFSY